MQTRTAKKPTPKADPSCQSEAPPWLVHGGAFTHKNSQHPQHMIPKTKKTVRKSLKMKLFAFWDTWEGQDIVTARARALSKFNISLKQHDKWLAQWRFRNS